MEVHSSLSPNNHCNGGAFITNIIRVQMRIYGIIRDIDGKQFLIYIFKKKTPGLYTQKLFLSILEKRVSIF
jgi:hypothetical protein